MASDSWPTIPLGELCDPDRGITYGIVKVGEFIAGGVPVIRGGDIRDARIECDDSKQVTEDVSNQFRRTILKGGEIVLNLIADPGHAAIVPRKLAGHNVSRDVAVIPLNGSVDVRFVNFYLRSKLAVDWLNARLQGSVTQKINLGTLRELPVPTPDLAEQKAIANILGALDDKIELNRRMNETLEGLARAIFQSWFVDFDPVRAQRDGLPPPALSPATAALFPDSFEDSELGKIPTGWEVKSLGDSIGFRSGFSFKSQDWQESGVPVVKIGSVKPGIIDLTQVSYVSASIAQQAARYQLSTGDMLIGMTGYVGEVGLVPPSDNPPLLNQRVGKFVMPKPGTESLGFWYCTTRQPEFRAFVEARSHGTAQANVSGEAIMEFPLVQPPNGILDEFNKTCRPMLERILANHGESRSLAAIRDALLPKLLSGEIRVAEAERLVEDAG